MKKAFTLVELAIVLVIIGLLTAGVVGGQSLINSAKRNAYITELSQINTGIRAFKLEYGQLPGDMNNAWDYWAGSCAGTQAECDGDNDRLLENDELFWNHLTLAGILSGKVQTNYLLYKFGKGDGFWRISSGNPVVFEYPSTTTFLVYQGGLISETIFNQKDSKYIDEKIDDGNPSSGKIVFLDCTTPSYAAATRGQGSFTNLSNNAKACRPWYIMDPNAY